jgi:hypothetical protein
MWLLLSRAPSEIPLPRAARLFSCLCRRATAVWTGAVGFVKFALLGFREVQTILRHCYVGFITNSSALALI